MKFKLSKYGIVLAIIFAVYFLFIYIADPSETGPLAFLWYLSMFFYLPSALLSAIIPATIPSVISFIFSLVVFYFVGAGVQKLVTKK